MRALVVGEKLHLDRVYPEPQPKQGEVLIRVTRAGICNTDIEIIRGYADFRGVLGHEFAGVVESGAWAGRRIAGEINIGCGECEFCQKGIPSQCLHRRAIGIHHQDGAFADQLVLPLENLHPLPDTITDEQAVFIEPLAAALETLAQTHISPHHRVILIGAGKLGLLTAQVISLTGCHLNVICRHERQFAMCQKWGLEAVSAQDIEPRCADIVVDCTGKPEGFAQALEWVKPQGIIHLKSTYHDLPPANLTRLVVDEIRIETSRCGSFPAAINLLRRGLVDVESLIDGRYSLEDGLKAIEHASQKGVLKIILDVG